MILGEEKAHEFVVRDELIEKREKIKTFDELVEFLQDVEKNYNYGYGVAPRAMAQASLAVAWYLADKFGITGFQAGFVMWDFIRGWNGFDNECGMKLVDYDKMLYPQYSGHFEKTIPSDVWYALQKKAKKGLEEADSGITVSHEVRQHWQSIVDDHVPFGYTVK